jgi:nuclear factor related to kappa-B-binding protein
MVNVGKRTFKWILPSDSPSFSLLERLEMLFYYASARVKIATVPLGEVLQIPKDYFRKQVCRVTFTELSQESIALYHIQEQERFDHEATAYFFNIDGYRSIVGPLRRPVKAPKKQREHPMLVEDRDFIVSLVNMVVNGGSRLPGGVGTRADVAQLVSYSKFVKPSVDMDKFNSVVSAALDRIQLVPDAPLKFDVDLKLWIYNHRLRNVEDFARIEAEIEAALKASSSQGGEHQVNEDEAVDGEEEDDGGEDT